MTAHHDKLVYGKLSRMQSELSDEEIENAVAFLNKTNVDVAEKSRSGEEKQKIAGRKNTKIAQKK